MKKRWYVVDASEGTLSWNYKLEKGEDFKTKAAATKRAVELANTEPRKAFLVCEAICVAVAETRPVIVFPLPTNAA